MKEKRPHKTLVHRRQFLQWGAALTIASALPAPAWAATGRKQRQPAERVLSLYNTHTGESLNTVYWLEGQYLPESLNNINYLMRDHRNGEVKDIDARLLELLYQISQRVESQQPINIISAYRSETTNAMLAEHDQRVAKHSLHIQGMAVDLRIPYRDLGYLKQAAMSLRTGGVGYYPNSNFLHIDVGTVRYWTG